MKERQKYIDFKAYERMQSHPFSKGNTRTTVVFTIKYLCSGSSKVNNESVVDDSGCFRNALVRANYCNPQKGIQPDKSFLTKFFSNLLLGEQNELKNRYRLLDEDNAPCAHSSLWS